MKKKVIISIIVFIAIVIIASISSVVWYKIQQKPVNSKNPTDVNIEITSGTSTNKILEQLKENELIRNVFATKIYIKLNEVSGLQAGKYVLNTGMSLAEILEQISSGKVINEQISITFLEGKNMRWIASKIAEQTNNKEQDVFNLLEDKQYIQTLIDKYWFLTEDITNEDIYYPLEGYLYPDTYNFENADVSVEKIFEVLLDETDEVLSECKDDIQKSGLNVHQLLTIASIVELEGKDEESRRGIASVIYNRLKNNMSLGSDVTTYYAIKVDMGERDLYSSEINEYNPYNTRGPNMNGKLPIGPISSVSKESIKAVLNPLSTNYLYFVADINGKIHFTSTYAEHQALINDLQKQGLWYTYE